MAKSKYVTFEDLIRFHREIVVPDIDHIVDQKLQGLRDDMFKHFDRMFEQLEFLAVEYQATKGGLKRLESRVPVIEERVTVLEKKTSHL